MSLLGSPPTLPPNPPRSPLPPNRPDTIISWTDPEVATDLALSFQESMGCAYIWDQICNVQRQIQLPSVLAAEVGKDSSELPAVETRTLPAIAKLVTDVSPFHRDRMASLILREGYVQRLVALFRASEGAHDTPALHHLYRVFKGLVLLNDSQLLEQLFAPDAIMDVIGALEYDPDVPCRQQHRASVQQQAVYREALPIPSAALLAKIHQTYRLGYIKDVILPRALDDQTFSSINSLILFNNVEVVTTLHSSKPFLADLFARLRTSDPHSPQFTDLVRFLQEFCSLHKHLQLAQRTSFFSALIALGLFDVCTLVMQHPLHSVRLSGIDILMSLMVPDPAPLRTFLVEQPSHALLSCLVRGMVACRQAEGGLHAQLLEMLRVLLDPDTMDAADKSKFLDLFYEDYLQLLISAVVAGTSASQPSTCPSAARNSTGAMKKRRAAQGRADGGASGRVDREAGRGAGGRGDDAEPAERDGAEGREAERGGGRGGGARGEEQGGTEGEERRGGEGGGGGQGEEPPSPDVLTSICDLLCFCVQHHSFRMKYYVLRNSVAEKVLRLTQRREKYLSVAAIRFLRCCVALKDDFYVRYLVKNRLLDPVMAAFRANGARYNLLNSAVLELIDFVRKENVRPLVAYIVESYGSWLDCIDYVDSFKLLRLKYEQNLESNRPAVPPPVVILPPSTSHHHTHHHHHHPHQHHHHQQQQHPPSSPPTSPPFPSAAAGAERHDNDAAVDAVDTHAQVGRWDLAFLPCILFPCALSSPSQSPFFVCCRPHAFPPFLPSAAIPTTASDEDGDNPESAPATVPGTHSPPLHPPHLSHLPIPLPSLHHPPRLHPRLPPHQPLSPTARRPFSRSPSPPLGRPSLSPPARPLSPSARHRMSRSPSPPPPLPPLPPINGTIGSESRRKRPRGCMDSTAAQAETGADGRGESGCEQGGESSEVAEGASKGRAAEGGEPGPSSKALGKKALCMRKRFLQVRTQDSTTAAPLGEVAPGGGAPKGRGRAQEREEPTLGVCSPRPVLCDPWQSARGKGRERTGSGEGDEGDGGDGGEDGEWAVRLAMAEEEEERRQGDGGDGGGSKGGGSEGARGGGGVDGECAGNEAACGDSDVGGKGGRDAEEGGEDMDGAGRGEVEGQEEEKTHGENAGSGAMSIADEAGGAEGTGGAGGADARTAAAGGAQGAARSVVEALR
ncbi:unnamed protein product [Closterium sp. Naga37s-1]|nr:unnamed protein product [Closterium sp. Naga37s-1]